MPPFYSFSQNTTTIDYVWPKELTGLERIAISSQGDLQRILSAFFARPIKIVTVFSHNSTHIESSPTNPSPTSTVVPTSIIDAASPTAPIVQYRQVLLQCAGKTVCTATSTVHMTSPLSARLFLQDEYAIGQMFKKLEKAPLFELLDAGLGLPDAAHHPEKEKQSGIEHQTGGKGDVQVWRKYRLSVPEFQCEIVEVFPSREMFVHGEDWLLATPAAVDISSGHWSYYALIFLLLLIMVVQVFL